MLKRFLVFSGYKDQCSNGWDQLVGSYDTEEEAIKKAGQVVNYVDNWNDPDYDGDYYPNYDCDSSIWALVIDTVTGRRVEEVGYEVP